MSFYYKKRQIFFVILDGAAVVLSWLAAVYLRHGELVQLPPYRTLSTYLIYLSVLVFVVLTVFYFMQVYKEFYSPIDRAARATVISFLLINLISYYFQEFAHSRLVIIIFSALFLLFASSWRIVFFLFNATEMGKRVFQRRTVIVGTGADAATLCDQISLLRSSPFEVVGLVSAERDNRDTVNDLSVLGTISDLEKIIQQHNIDELIITQDELSTSRLWSLKGELRKTGVSVKIAPLGLEDIIADSDMDELRSDLPVIEFVMDPISGWQKLVKRIMDISISSFLLVLTSPLFAVICLLIKREANGPVFYFQERLGRHGEPFKVVKFRTMIPGAEEETGPIWAEKDDTRATRVGTRLRRLGLDELPQLFNIVRGEMSLVGPRPERPYFAELHHELTQRRLSVKPGITGLAQVSSRYALSVEEKVKYDLFYIQNFSLSLDVALFIRTVSKIVREEIITVFSGDR